VIEEALKVSAAYLIQKVLKIYQDNSNITKKDLNNLHFGVDMVELSNAHIKFVTFFNFKQRLEQGNITCGNN